MNENGVVILSQEPVDRIPLLLQEHATFSERLVTKLFNRELPPAKQVAIRLSSPPSQVLSWGWLIPGLQASGAVRCRSLLPTSPPFPSAPHRIARTHHTWWGRIGCRDASTSSGSTRWQWQRCAEAARPGDACYTAPWCRDRTGRRWAGRGSPRRWWSRCKSTSTRRGQGCVTASTAAAGQRCGPPRTRARTA
jgi:hypothetical protein